MCTNQIFHKGIYFGEKLEISEECYILQSVGRDYKYLDFLKNQEENKTKMALIYCI